MNLQSDINAMHSIKLLSNAESSKLSSDGPILQNSSNDDFNILKKSNKDLQDEYM